MKRLIDITKEEAQHICLIKGEKFVDWERNDDGQWDNIGLAVAIYTNFSSTILIFENGMIIFYVGSTYKSFDEQPIYDYLTEQGYEFSD